MTFNSLNAYCNSLADQIYMCTLDTVYSYVSVLQSEGSLPKWSTFPGVTITKINIPELPRNNLHCTPTEHSFIVTNYIQMYMYDVYIYIYMYILLHELHHTS